jgi:hypothetical protein
MKYDPEIDELLNAFIDGELTDRHRTEVQRLISHDPQIAARLRQLEKCKMLVESLPRAKAPAQMLEQIRRSLEGKKRADMQSAALDQRQGARHLFARKMLAAAAMIALVGVLTTVVYTIVTPESTPPRDWVKGPQQLTPAAGQPEPEAPEFYGRVELSTASLAAVDSVIRRTIDDYGLSLSAAAEQRQDTKAYTISCSREKLGLLLADLRNIWDKLDSAVFFVDTTPPGQQVTVQAITAQQIITIVNQNTTEARLEVARDFALLNLMDQLVPGREILAALEDSGASLTAPKPLLTGERVTKAPAAETQTRNVHLTVVIAGSR